MGATTSRLLVRGIHYPFCSFFGLCTTTSSRLGAIVFDCRGQWYVRSHDAGAWLNDGEMNHACIHDNPLQHRVLPPASRADPMMLAAGIVNEGQVGRCVGTA